MERIEITAVANGYIVNVLPNKYRDQCVQDGGSVYVFESMDSLTKWVKDNIKNK